MDDEETMSYSEVSLLARVSRNSPTVVDVSLECYNRAIGQALLANPFVSRLSVGLPDVFENEFRDIFDSFQPLLTFIQTSRSLQEMSMKYCDSPEENPMSWDTLTARMIQAASENTSIAKLFASAHCVESQVALANLIATNRSIRDLDIDLFYGIQHNEAQQIGDALGSNTTLTRLGLRHCSDLPIFEKLHLLTALEHLSIEQHFGVVLASGGLGPFLRGTRTLQHLSLEQAKFNEEFSDAWDAIGGNQNLKQLDITSCIFDARSTRHFLRAMSNHPNLRIKIRGCSFDGRAILFKTVVFSSRSVVDAETLLRKLRAAANTMGSTLQFHLALHVSDIIRPNERAAMLKCLCRNLPSVLNLTHLTLETPSRPIRAASFIPALRQNGSLHTVVIDNPDVGALDHSQAMRLIQAFCERNKQVPQLLQCDITSPLLVPALLEGTKQAARMAPNAALYTALAQGQKVCPSLHTC